MTVTVKLFAAARDLIGSAEVRLDLADGATIADLKRTLEFRFPQVAGLLTRSAIARNLDYAREGDVVLPADELAVIPPVSGG